MADQSTGSRNAKSWTSFRILLPLACAIVLAGLLVPALVIVNYWVGSCDLTIEFVVHDGNTSKTIPDAKISFQDWGGFYEGGDHVTIKEYDRTADETGRCFRACPRSMCFGTGSLFTSTFNIHLPDWTVTVSKEGYDTSQMLDVNDPKNQNQVHRFNGKAYLIIPIRLHPQGQGKPVE
jgi:hypothetical protein